MSTRPARLAAAALLGLCVLSACKRAAPPPPPAPKPAALPQTPAVPVRTREQAVAALMALPEIKAWSDQIEKNTRGKAHGAVIEDNPAPRIVDGKPYYQLSFVEDTKQAVHRRASFLVARQGDEILVEDAAGGTLQSLAEWRRNVRPLELKSG